MVPCKSTAEEVSFEWSHHRISSTDSKVRTTLHVSITDADSDRIKHEVSVPLNPISKKYRRYLNEQISCPNTTTRSFEILWYKRYFLLQKVVLPINSKDSVVVYDRYSSSSLYKVPNIFDIALDIKDVVSLFAHFLPHANVLRFLIFLLSVIREAVGTSVTHLQNLFYRSQNAA